MVKGQHSSCKEGVPFPGGLDLLPAGHPGLCRPSFLGSSVPWALLPLHFRVWLLLSQGRLTSLAPAVFWLIKEEQTLRAEASPFHPRAWFC